MKIRSVCVGVQLCPADFEEIDGICNMESKLTQAKLIIDECSKDLTSLNYEVQTGRITFNSMEDWILLSQTMSTCEAEQVIASHLNKLIALLDKFKIDFCSLGGCSSSHYVVHIPYILSLSTRLCTSIRIDRVATDNIAPSFEMCQLAAKTTMEVSSRCGDLGNFRHCVSFNIKPNTPFFPCSFHESNCSDYNVSVGLENGDLLFISFFGADTFEEGRANLITTMFQTIAPIQQIVDASCTRIRSTTNMPVTYYGIDASLNPGLALPESVASGIEALLQSATKNADVQFGHFSSISAVSTITSALKYLKDNTELKLIGYNGLMLPIMEDIIMSTREVRMRDLLMMSSVCGVGLDTVPIPGDTSAEALALVYCETGSLSLRLQDKPLSVRVLPMANKNVGEFTEIESPYLCNTRVFSVEC